MSGGLPGTIPGVVAPKVMTKDLRYYYLVVRVPPVNPGHLVSTISKAARKAVSASISVVSRISASTAGRSGATARSLS